MKLQYLITFLIYLFSFSSILFSQSDIIGVLPYEAIIVEEYETKIRIFSIKKDLEAAMNVKVLDEYSAQYDAELQKGVKAFFDNIKDPKIARIEASKFSQTEEEEYAIFRMNLFMRELPRYETFEKGISLDVGGQNKKRKEANSALLSPLANKFADEANADYLLSIQVRGLQKEKKKPSEKMYGGMFITVAIVDGATGLITYAKTVEIGRKVNAQGKYTSRAYIDEADMVKKLEKLLEKALAKFAKLNDE